MRQYEIEQVERLVGKGFTIVKKFDVLHHQWECDGYGYIVSDSLGGIKLLLTNHGSFYLDDGVELRLLIDYYEQVIINTEDALSLLGGLK